MPCYYFKKQTTIDCTTYLCDDSDVHDPFNYRDCEQPGESRLLRVLKTYLLNFISYISPKCNCIISFVYTKSRDKIPQIFGRSDFYSVLIKMDFTIFPRREELLVACTFNIKGK